MIKKNKAAIAALFLGASVCYFNCTTINNKNIKQIDLLVNYPVTIANKGEISFFNLKYTISIFYYKGFVIYKLLPKRNLATTENILATNSYFIYKNKIGVFFKTLTDSSGGIKYPVDSFLF